LFTREDIRIFCVDTAASHKVHGRVVVICDRVLVRQMVYKSRLAQS